VALLEELAGRAEAAVRTAVLPGAAVPSRVLSGILAAVVPAAAGAAVTAGEPERQHSPHQQRAHGAPLAGGSARAQHPRPGLRVRVCLAAGLRVAGVERDDGAPGPFDPRGEGRPVL